MKLISRDELKEKLDRGDHFKLVNTLGDLAFETLHIPGSIHLSTRKALSTLDPDEEIVVYCANVDCHASVAAFQFLETHGYKNVRRYAGGIQDWEAAGYPLEGEWIHSK